MCINDLVVTINFGEVSPLNTNSIVKVVVPIALRSNQPYQVAVSMSGLTNANVQALQASDVGFGLQNIRLLGGAGQICNQSTHIIRSPFNNDPAITATIGGNGRVSYPSSLANLSGSTIILSGPELSKNNSSKRQQSDGWVFDAIFALTPQFFAAGVSSATLIFHYLAWSKRSLLKGFQIDVCRNNICRFIAVLFCLLLRWFASSAQSPTPDADAETARQRHLAGAGTA